jgi:predicted glycoside hydrolase/deacetylase ChbG (UPF0249 family)
MKYLIVNADDFGISRGVNRGIIEAHRHGILTSTSLMVNRAAAGEAAALARDAPALSVGLHLELEDAAGAELNEQVDRFERLMGRPPTHIDSHHAAHRHPELQPQVLALGEQLGVPVRGHSPVALFHRFYGQWGGETHLEQVSVESLAGMLETDVGEGVTELICHPGYADAELTSSYALEREAELRTLCDPLVRTALAAQSIQLISFADLRRVLLRLPG